MSRSRVLIAEDHEQTLEFYARTLRHDGLDVATCLDGGTALDTWSTHHFDLVVLDLRLPVMSGYDVCRQMRRRGDQTPVLALTGLTSEASELEAFAAGADDYVIKPCSFDRLRARVRALLRRSKQAPPRQWALGPWMVDEQRGTAEISRSGTVCRSVVFSSLELRMLTVLAERAGKVIGREEILARCWHGEKTPSDNALAAVAARLRRKLEGSGVAVRAARGAGLLLEIADERSRGVSSLPRPKRLTLRPQRAQG